MRNSRYKELAEWADTARSAGWTVEFTRGGHMRWTNPEGKVTFTPATPGKARALKNIRAQLRRNGLQV